EIVEKNPVFRAARPQEQGRYQGDTEGAGDQQRQHAGLLDAVTDALEGGAWRARALGAVLDGLALCGGFHDPVAHALCSGSADADAIGKLSCWRCLPDRSVGACHFLLFRMISPIRVWAGVGAGAIRTGRIIGAGRWGPRREKGLFLPLIRGLAGE